MNQQNAAASADEELLDQISELLRGDFVALDIRDQVAAAINNRGVKGVIHQALSGHTSTRSP